jgi:hypothetical protein
LAKQAWSNISTWTYSRLTGNLKFHFTDYGV